MAPKALDAAHAFLAANIQSGMDRGSADFLILARQQQHDVEQSLIVNSITTTDATAMLNNIRAGDFPLPCRAAIAAAINRSISSGRSGGARGGQRLMQNNGFL
ncbi:unnamed protein product [Prorocentrum cordatum]|uniref:Uncharacterized protein n=1 Tax=Prorocentrum cordatum TaxID=2364126 RepID=A0ABN9TAD2_9DINO|nr:unnamed protein product [Polarella glacialis]